MKYFLDTSIIVDYTDENKERHLETVEKLQVLLHDSKTEFMINRLVYIECLRTISKKDDSVFNNVKEILEDFQEVEINQFIYDEVINFSRFCISQNPGFTLKGRCAAIDFIHFITAKHYGLTMLCFDKGMITLETYYKDFINKR